jgi:hypothetical protein
MIIAPGWYPRLLPMDLSKMIAELLEQKQELDQAIAALEELAGGKVNQPGLSRSRRGRKSMSAEEREQVSERMKKYWAKRRHASR